MEKFRQNLTGSLHRNLERNFNYRLMRKYGLIEEHIEPVVFYFEKVGQRVQEDD